MIKESENAPCKLRREGERQETKMSSTGEPVSVAQELSELKVLVKQHVDRETKRVTSRI